MNSVRYSEYLSPLALSLLLAVIAYLVYLWLLPKPFLNVPHNPVTSIWGDIPELDRFMEGGKRNIADYFISFAAKYGPLSQVMVARARIVLVADRAEYERLLLRTKSTEQSRWTNGVFGTVIPTSQISLPTNEMWRRHRQLTGPSMSRRYLEHMSARVSAGANNLARLWTRKVELIGDKAFDADSDLKLAIMDTILSITMGDSPSFIDVIHASLPNSPSSLASDTSSAQFPQPDPPPLHKALRAMMASLERVQFTALPLPVARILTWISPSWRRSYNTISDFLNNKIAEARAREAELEEAKQGEGLATDADCVVDMIAQREAREEADTFDGGELLDELMAYVLAGQDTTAATLSWLFKYLPLDTEIQQRLHDELCTAFGPVPDEEGPLDFNILNDSSKVPVLEAIVAETQRCAMIVPIVGRELVADEVILGQHIPKGGQLMFLLGYMHMQESEWGPDATTWRPARWLRDDGSFNSAAGPTFPFGIGQRACFGQRLAILQLKTFVATLSRVFMFKPLPSDVDNWDAILKITREPKSFHVSLDRRSVD